MSEQEETAGSEGYSTEFANFLAVCWEMPAEFLEMVFMETENIAQRNNWIVNECFEFYLEVYHEITNFWSLTENKREKLIQKHYDNFLAESVRTRYMYGK